jgi:hypothetical protein
MHEEHRTSEADASKAEYRYEFPEDETDRQIRFLGKCISRKFKKASALDLFQMVCGTVLAMAAIVTAVIYGKQLGAMNQQLGDSENTTRASTQTQILTNLPLIAPSDLRLNWNNTKSGPGVLIREDFRNIGETRAVAPDIYAGWGNELPNDETHYQVHFGDLIKWTWAASDAKIGAECVALADAKALENEVNTGAKPVYFYVKIRYDDVFPPDNKAKHPRNDHLVEFCRRINHIEIDEKDKGIHTTWYGEPCPGRLDCIDGSCGTDYKAEYKNDLSPSHIDSEPHTCNSLIDK